MNHLKKALFLSISLLSVSVFAQEQGEYQQWLSVASKMNWSKGMVMAEGFGVAPEGKREQVGRLLACRAAVTDAQRNLLESAKGVQVTVDTSISKMAAQYDTVKSAVDGIIKGATILEREMVDDDTCKVLMGIFIGGKLTESIYEKTIDSSNKSASLWHRFISGDLPLSFIASAHAQTSVSEALPEPLTEEFERLNKRVSRLETSLLTINPQYAQAKDEEQPSGLILDVRGHRFLPSMTPSLKQPDGSIIYPSLQDKDTLVSSGKLLALFSRSIEFAMNHPIVGDRPLLLKASADTTAPTNVKLSAQNSQRLVALARQEFFKTPKIIIVLD